VGQALGQVPGQVVVRGYTDNTPIRTLRFPSNWELSQDRARAVADMLARSLSDPSRVQAQGRADTEPVAPNNSAEGRARNRRVEIILMVAPQARDAALQTPEARPAAADPTGNK
jgi:type VI secretion system protein ImpK